MTTISPTVNDYPEIFLLLERAFAPSVAETTLVRDLRDTGKISLDLMIRQNGKVAAYVCYSAAYDDNGTVIGYHLAPLAVLPERQRKGLGKRITTESLKLLPRAMPVYVLGDPEYYGQFGFNIDRTQKCSFDPEGLHFMVLSADRLPERDVLYERIFYDLA